MKHLALITLLLINIHSYAQLSISNGESLLINNYSVPKESAYLNLKYIANKLASDNYILESKFENIDLKKTLLSSDFIRINSANIFSKDIEFKKSGLYTFYILENEVILDSLAINISIDQNELFSYDVNTITSEDNYLDPSSTMYFINSRITFCTSLTDQGKATDEANIYNIRKSLGSYIYICLDNNNKKFASNKIVFDIYRNSKKDKQTFVETREFSIDSKDSYGCFKYTFYEKGIYTIKAYTDNEVWINDAEVTIQYQ